ncbi:hypothetical protein NQ318_020677 [Aromia moschata]|uniref:FZ domain-containing protein n=1 Tax=Aromia moschata TaxID=1265417 RepID=A0AAV8XWG1_9CUCU|nr:hypothetical protein NQ318_020677 [Aromia moschata]
MEYYLCFQIPPPIPLRPPPVPKRNFTSDPKSENKTVATANRKPAEPPPLPPTPKCRALPSNPFSDNKPKPPTRQISVEANNINHGRKFDVNRNCSKQITKSSNFAFEANGTNQNQDATKLPPAPVGPPPPAPKVHKSSIVTNKVQGNQVPHTRVSIRQDSSVSSDSFSQTSSPSYTSKTMETPLLPPRTPQKQHNSGLIPKVKDNEDDTNGNSTITKSASTPASLQTIVRFHNGSNMSLHHRIIRDMRRPSAVYASKIKFRFVHLIINTIALFAIGAGMAAYFKAYPNAVTIVNKTVNVTTSPVIIERKSNNPAPGICLPIIVPFCRQHGIPYNFTVFPNYMGNCGQRDAQQELEVYDAVVDVPPVSTDLFISETKRRCGFFLDVFGLALPDYLDCLLFPESSDRNICVGHHEVKVAKLRASRPV